MKAILMAALLAILLTVSSAMANPVERAQLVKSLVLQRLTQDGWQLVQESQSLLTFERRGNVTQTFLMHVMTGASGTWASERLSITVVPITDHLTEMPYVLSVNSQNAFGQMTSVPIRNGKTDAYIESIYKSTAARLPKQYRSAKFTQPAARP